jgi:hypothetical protein
LAGTAGLSIEPIIHAALKDRFRAAHAKQFT